MLHLGINYGIPDLKITVCNGNFVGRVILSPTHIRTHLHIHIHTQAHIVAEKIVAFYCKQEETKRAGRIFVRHFRWLSLSLGLFYCRSFSFSEVALSLRCAAYCDSGQWAASSRADELNTKGSNEFAARSLRNENLSACAQKYATIFM